MDDDERLAIFPEAQPEPNNESYPEAEQER